MAQWGRVLAAKHKDPSSIPGTHTLERENGRPELSCNLHMYAAAWDEESDRLLRRQTDRERGRD